MNDKELAVLEYVRDHDNSPLHFQDDIEYHPGRTTMRMLVFRILDKLATRASINKDGIIETSSGRRRSALDIWRHVIYYRPKATIFWVMRTLWKLNYEEGILSGQYCNATSRRVMRLTVNVPYGYRKGMFNETTKDEFGLVFSDWRIIGKEEELE